MKEIKSCIQGTPQWLLWRTTGITATDAASIMLPSKWGSGYSVWCSKTKRTPIEDSKSEKLEWGHRLEPVVFNKFKEQHPEYIEYRPSTLYADDWKLASLDGEAIDATGMKIIIECKTSRIEQEALPERYFYQVQWQMLVTGARKAYVAMLMCGSHYIEYEVLFNEDIAATMIAKAAMVWDAVKTDYYDEKLLGLCPLDCELIKKEQHNGLTMPVDTAMYERYVELAKQISELEEELKTTKAFLLKQSQTCDNLMYNNKRVVTWIASAPRTSVDSKKLEKKFPDIYKQVLVTKNSTSYARVNIIKPEQEV